MTNQSNVCERCGSILAEGDKFCPMCRMPAKEARGKIAYIKYLSKTKPSFLLLAGISLGIFIVASAVFAPQYWEDWNQKGKEALDKNDFHSSVKYFGKALELNPSSEEALKGLGDAYFNLIQLEGNNYALPLSYYKKAYENSKTSSSVDALNMIGSIYLTTGDYEGAQRQFQKIIDQDKKDPLDLATAWYYMGSALMGMNNCSGAIEYFNNSIAISTEEIEGGELLQNALASMGEAYMMENKTGEAEKCYKDALDASTNCENCNAACYDLIKIYEKANRMDEAKEYETKCGLSKRRNSL